MTRNSSPRCLGLAVPARACLLLAVALSLFAGGRAAAQAPAADLATRKVQAAASALVKGQHQQAIDLYSEALTDTTLSNDRRATILNDRGIAHARIGSGKAAIDDFNRAVQLYPEYSVVYNNRGNVLLSLGLPLESVKDFDRAITLAPVYAAAFNNRATAHMRLGDADAAIRDYNRAITLSPGSAAPYNGRGRAHLQQGRPFAGMRDFTRALALDVRFAAAYRSRAEARLQLERATEAVEDLSRAIAFDAQSVELHLLRGQAYLTTRNIASALKDFARAAELDPKSASALVMRGYGQAIAEAYDDALNDFAKALELDPRSALAHAYRAWTYKQMAQAELGLKDVERGMAIDPARPELLWARAEIREALEQTEAAIADLRQAIAIRPGMREVVAALERHGISTSAEDVELTDLAMGKWRVVGQGRRYFALHPDLGRLRVPLETIGAAPPKLVEWTVQPAPHQAFGVLRIASGTVAVGAKSEDIEHAAIIDIAGRTIVGIEPLRRGEQRSTLAWEAGKLVVTSLDGFTHELSLKGVAPQVAAAPPTPAPAVPTSRRESSGHSPGYKPSGTPAWAPWAGPPGADRPPPSRSAPAKKPKTLFDLLFN